MPLVETFYNLDDPEITAILEQQDLLPLYKTAGLFVVHPKGKPHINTLRWGKYDLRHLTYTLTAIGDTVNDIKEEGIRVAQEVACTEDSITIMASGLRRYYELMLSHAAEHDGQQFIPVSMAEKLGWKDNLAGLHQRIDTLGEGNFLPVTLSPAQKEMLPDDPFIRNKSLAARVDWIIPGGEIAVRGVRALMPSDLGIFFEQATLYTPVAPGETDLTTEY